MSLITNAAIMMLKPSGVRRTHLNRTFQSQAFILLVLAVFASVVSGCSAEDSGDHASRKIGDPSKKVRIVSFQMAEALPYHPASQTAKFRLEHRGTAILTHNTDSLAGL